MRQKTTSGWLLSIGVIALLMLTGCGPTPVPAPSKLQAMAGDGQVKLAWQSTLDPSISGFFVYRDGKRLTKVGRVLATTVQAANGVKASFALAAVATDGRESNRTPAVSVTPLPAPPTIPAGLTATASNAAVRLQWTASSRAIGYQVQRNGQKLVDLPASPLSYTDTSLVNGTSYQYRLVALDRYGRLSGASAAATARPLPTPPLAPAFVTAVAGDVQVALTWQTAAGAVSYRVLRDGAQIASVDRPSFLDVNLINGTHYIYQLRSEDAFGQISQPTSGISAVPLPVPPTAPAAPTAFAGDRSVSLMWQPDGLVTYRVLRDGAEIGTSTTGAYTDTTVTNGVTYDFQLVAVDQHRQASPSSATVTIRPMPQAPEAPPAPIADGGDGTVNLTWQAGNLLEYRVLRNGVEVGSSTTGSYIDRSVTNGIGVRYRLQAQDAFGQLSPIGAEALAVPHLASTSAPPAPSGVSATAVSGSSVRVSWSPVATATSYRVLRVTSSGAFVEVASVTEPTYLDEGLAVNSVFTWQVRAATDNGVGPVSSSVVGNTTIPPKPGISSVSGSRVSLVWDQVPGASSYRVERATSPEGPFTTVSTVSPQYSYAPNFNDTTVVVDTVYYYRVAAIGAGWTTLPGPASASALPLNAPSGVSATAVSGSSVRVSWSPVATATSYRVLRVTSSGAFVEVASVTEPTYLDEGLAVNSVFTWQVRAATDNGVGPVSSSVVGNTTIPPKPGISSVSGSRVSLVWDQVPGASSYRVERATSPEGPFTTVSTVSPQYSYAPNFNDTTVVVDTVYYYRVAAIGAGWTTLPGPASASALPLNAPSGVSATAVSGSSVRVSWSPVATATSYRVLRVTSSGAFVEVASVTEPTYLDEGLAVNSVFTWQVRAATDNGVGPVSSSVVGNTTIPPKPGISSVSGSRVSLVWDQVPGASSYRVERATSPEGPFTTVSTVSPQYSYAPNFNDTTVVVDTVYYYRVAAIGAGWTTLPGPASASALPLNAPSGVSATAVSGSSVRVSWSPVATATSYRVLRVTSSGAFVEVASVTEPTYLDEGLAVNSVFTWQVRAATDNGVGPVSSSVVGNTTIPPKPGISSVSGSRVSLVWDQVPGASSYRVERATSPEGPFTTVSTVSPQYSYAPNFNDTTVVVDTVYYYRVAAIGAGWTTLPGPASASALPLNAPSGVSATAVSGSSVRVSWSPVATATSYRVLRVTSSGAFVEVASVTEPTYLDEGLAVNSVFTWQVRAATDNGVGPVSSSVVGNTTIPPKPGISSVSGSRVSLVWDQVPGASSYRVERATSPEGPFTTVSTVSPQYSYAPNFNDTTVVVDTVYYYRVAAIGAGWTTLPGPASASALPTP